MKNILWRKLIAGILSVLIFAGLFKLAGLLDLGPKNFVYALSYGVVLLGCPIMMFLLVSGSERRTVLQALRIVLSLLMGFLGLLPLGALFDTMNWPIFHSWGLGHGSFLVAAPAIGSITFFLLGRAFRLTKQEIAT
jgi:hypothetical protein